MVKKVSRKRKLKIRKLKILVLSILIVVNGLYAIYIIHGFFADRFEWKYLVSLLLNAGIVGIFIKEALTKKEKKR